MLTHLSLAAENLLDHVKSYCSVQEWFPIAELLELDDGEETLEAFADLLLSGRLRSDGNENVRWVPAH